MVSGLGLQTRAPQEGTGLADECPASVARSIQSGFVGRVVLGAVGADVLGYARGVAVTDRETTPELVYVRALVLVPPRRA